MEDASRTSAYPGWRTKGCQKSPENQHPTDQQEWAKKSLKAFEKKKKSLECLFIPFKLMHIPQHIRQKSQSYVQ